MLRYEVFQDKIPIGKDLWRTQKESEFYDYKLIEHRLNNFRTLAQKGNIHGLLSAIQESNIFLNVIDKSNLL